MTDTDYLDLALRHAEEALARGDWPVAALLVRDGAVLAVGQNRQNTELDLTGHAEFVHWLQAAMPSAPPRVRTGRTEWPAAPSTRRWSLVRCAREP